MIQQRASKKFPTMGSKKKIVLIQYKKRIFHSPIVVYSIKEARSPSVKEPVTLTCPNIRVSLLKLMALSLGIPGIQRRRSFMITLNLKQITDFPKNH